MSLLWSLIGHQLLLLAKVSLLACVTSTKHASLLADIITDRHCQQLTRFSVQSLASFTRNWVESCMPTRAVHSGVHIVYLMSTGSFCAACWFVIGHMAAKDGLGQPKVSQPALAFAL